MIMQANPGMAYRAHRDEIDAAVHHVLESGRYILGEQVKAFETAFAAYCGVAYAVGVASGTDALHLALRACGVGSGDEVITVAHTAVATVAAVELAGARPVLVDIDPAHYTLDPARLESVLTPRTRAVIPVHLYGCPADLSPIRDWADRHGVWVIEDCAQAHGAWYQGRRVGAWGHLATFSFYPTKNLGAFGDGGAVVTDDPVLAGRLRELREYGWRERYISADRGFNSRLDELQAAILNVKLRYLDQDNEKRRKLADIYNAMLRESDLILPVEPPRSTHVYHLYVVRSKRRDALRAWLYEQGIGTAIHYPQPVHLQPAYADLGYSVGSLPATEWVAGQVLSLPLYPELEEVQVQRIAEAILQFEGATSAALA